MKNCEICGKRIKPNEEHCYEIRYGYIDEDGEFHPEQEVALRCESCGVEP